MLRMLKQEIMHQTDQVKPPSVMMTMSQEEQMHSNTFTLQQSVSRPVGGEDEELLEQYVEELAAEEKVVSANKEQQLENDRVGFDTRGHDAQVEAAEIIDDCEESGIANKLPFAE